MTKAQMLAKLQERYDTACMEWQISEDLLESENMSDFERNCIERCAIREYQELETIASIAKELFNVDFSN